MGAATSADEAPLDTSPPAPSAEALLDVLDALSHDAAVVDALLSYVTSRCELFEESEELPLACTEVHLGYQRLYERCLNTILSRVHLSEDGFAELMRRAVAEGSEEAACLCEHAAAAEDFLAFAALMRSRRRQLVEEAASGRAPSREQREVLRAHMWGLRLRG